MASIDCTVSVIIPLYNSASTLPRAVTSACRQTMPDIEIIIIDDGSSDSSLADARSLAATDARIRVIALPANRGKAHAMNHAMSEARGAWIAVLDADDWYEPQRLASLVTAGVTHGVALAADNQQFWDADAGVMVRTAFPVSRGNASLTCQQFIAGSDPYADFDYGMLKPLIRADWLRNARLGYRESARLSEDFLFLFDFFAAGGSGVMLAEPTYNWTQSFGTVSRQWTTTGAGRWRYDYQSAIAAHAEVLDALDTQQHPALADLLVTRMRAFQRLHHLGTLNRMRSSGAGLRQILGKAIQHPSIWPHLALRLIRG